MADIADSVEFDPFSELQEALLVPEEPASGSEVGSMRPSSGTYDKIGNADSQFHSGRSSAMPRQSASEPSASYEGYGGRKFVAVSPEAFSGGAQNGEPFVLIPANVHSLVPKWVWGAVAVLLIGMIVMIVSVPAVRLNQTIARLGDPNPGNRQAAQQQLIINSNKNTIEKLFEIAASETEKMELRLNAVDTLGLFDGSSMDAYNALLRLELSSSTDIRVKEAAIAARRQREAAKTRNIQR